MTARLIREGLQCLGRKEYEPAARVFRDVLELHADHAEAHHGLGVALDALGQYSEAQEHLERAHALAPHTIQYVQSMACTLLHLDRAADALPLAERVVAERPDFEAYGNLSCVLARLERLDDAMAALERALAIAPAMAGTIAADPDLLVLHDHPRFARLIGLDASLTSQSWNTWLDQPPRWFASVCRRLLADGDADEQESLIVEVTSLLETSDAEPGQGCAADGALMRWTSELGEVLFDDLEWLRARLIDQRGAAEIDLLSALIALRCNDTLRDRARQLARSEAAAIRSRIVEATRDPSAADGLESLMRIVRDLRMVEVREELRALLNDLARRPERVDSLVAYALPALAVIADPSSIDDFLVWRDDRQPLVRNALAIALGAFGQATPQVRQVLHASLGADEHWIRRSAAVALGALGAADSLDPLHATYRREPEWSVKLAIANAVAASEDDRVVGLLLEMSADAEASVVLAALRGLRAIPLGEPAREIVRRREHDPNPLIRRAAADVLADR